MSLLDSIEKSRVDILDRLDRRPDVVLLPLDKMPIDYLSSDRSHFQMYLKVQNSLADDEYAIRVGRYVIEYLYSVPCIEDVSTCVLTPIPYGLTWTDRMYEMLVSSFPNQNSTFHCQMLMVSFKITRVRTYYSLLKLFIKLRNNGPYRFPRTSAVVLTWIDGGFRRYLEINDSFLRQMGLKQQYNITDLYSSMFANTLDSLINKLGIVNKKNNKMIWYKSVFDKDEYAKAAERYWNRCRKNVG